MKTSRIDWAKFISEEAKVSPLLKSDEIARRPGMSELVPQWSPQNRPFMATSKPDIKRLPQDISFGTPWDRNR